jgi:hypothetical protein
MGHTHIILAAVGKDTLHDALLTAYRLRVARNSAPSKSKSRSKVRKLR